MPSTESSSCVALDVVLPEGDALRLAMRQSLVSRSVFVEPLGPRWKRLDEIRYRLFTMVVIATRMSCEAGVAEPHVALLSPMKSITRAKRSASNSGDVNGYLPRYKFPRNLWIIVILKLPQFIDLSLSRIESKQTFRMLATCPGPVEGSY